MARPGLDRHAKFRTLCRLLGEPRPHVLGYLEMIWATAYESGNPFIGDALAVESCAEYPGEAGKLANALLTCGGQSRPGFIEPVPGRDGCYQVHDLFHHAPKYVSKRSGHGQRRQADKTCAHCGAAYTNPDPRSKYCSPSCRSLHSRAAVDGKLTEVDGSDAQTCGVLADVDTPPSTQHPAPKNTPPTPPAGGETGKVSGRKRATTEALPPIPAELDTPEFRAAWSDWLEHRRQRKPKVTPKSAEMAFREMAAWGPQRAVAAIFHSVASGWQGIHEARCNAPPSGGGSEIDAAELRRQVKEQLGAKPLTRNDLIAGAPDFYGAGGTCDLTREAGDGGGAEGLDAS